MRTNIAPVSIDRLAISLRWVILLGLSIAIAAQERFSLYLIVTFLAAGIWNLVLTALSGISKRPILNRHLIIALDLLVANLLFFFSGHRLISLGWIGILPLISSVLYFDMSAVVIVGLVSAISLGIQSFTPVTPLYALRFIGAASLFYVVIGSLLFYLRDGPTQILGDILKKRVVIQPESGQAGQGQKYTHQNPIPGSNDTLNLRKVLETTLDLSIKSLERSKKPTKGLVCSVLIYPANNSNGAHLKIGPARRFSHADIRASISPTKGLVGQAIESGKPLLSKQIHSDDELNKFMAVRSCQSAYCVPLRNGLDTYGALFFAHPDENYFTTERREILSMVAAQARFAIQNAKLYRDLELEKDNLLKAQEEDRKKLVRTLHDGPTQSVAALAMRVNFARRLLERNDESVVDELIKAEDLARRTTKEIRNIIFTLKPPVLESEGLIPALQSMTDRMLVDFGLNVTIEVDPDALSNLDMNDQTTLLSMVEEAVYNTRKNTNAKDIWVRLKALKPGTILLEIQDNGNRFDEDGIAASDLRPDPLSMTSIREKAELLNGIVSVQSANGNGTLLQILINQSE
jgi:signal transduction histidine kinase